MHFSTFVSTLLSASIAVTGVAGSDITERATKNTAADVATFKSIVSDPTAFCSYWQAEYRTRTPFKELSVAQVNNVCSNVLPPAAAITTCVKTDLAKLKAVFTEPQYFCNFYGAITPRLISPFTNVNATALMAVCKYCLPSTSSTLSPAVKATSTSVKSSSQSSSKSSSFTTLSKSSSMKSSSASSKSSSISSAKSSSTSSKRSSGVSSAMSSSSASRSASSSVNSYMSSSASVSATRAAAASSLASSTTTTSATPIYTGQGYLYAVNSNTTADTTALEGFTSGATDVGFGLTNSGYSYLPYSLDNAGYLYLGQSGVLLSGLTSANAASKLGALANGTSNWTPVTCAIDNSTSELSCSYKTQYNKQMNVFQLYTGTSNGATAYYLQMAPSGSTAGVTIKALPTYTASASASSTAATATESDGSSPTDAAAASTTAAPTDAPATTASVTTVSTATVDFATLTCDTAPTGVFNIYASNSSSDPGAVGKPLRNSYSNYAAFYLTDTETFPVLNFTYNATTQYVASTSVVSGTTDNPYLVAATSALVETGVAVLPLGSGSTYTPLQCAIDETCKMKCTYNTAYYMNYTVAQIFNVLDLQYNTNNQDDFYTLEMNQYGKPIGVELTVVPVVDVDDDSE